MSDDRSSLEKALAQAQEESERSLRRFYDKITAQWDCPDCGEKDNDGEHCSACGEEQPVDRKP